MPIIEIIIIDDHPAIAHGTKMILEQNLDYRVAAVVTDVDAVMDALLYHRPQVVLVDMYMPKMNGRELASIIKNASPKTKIIFFSGFDLTPLWNQLNRIGVSGILSKNVSPQQIMRMVGAVLDGETVIPFPLMQHLVYNENPHKLIYQVELNEREIKIMDMVCKGMNNQEIAKEYLVSTRTAENYLSRIYEKLGVKSRIEAIEAFRVRYEQLK